MHRGPLSPHWTSHSFRECAGGRLWPVCTEHRQKAHGGSSIITVHSWWKGTWSWADSFYRPYRDGVNHRPDDADIMPELFRSSADPHQWCRAGTNIQIQRQAPWSSRLSAAPLQTGRAQVLAGGCPVSRMFSAREKSLGPWQWHTAQVALRPRALSSAVLASR